MNKHFKYLSYVLRHKWFVFYAGFKLKNIESNIPWFRLIIHDWSKFLPSEFIPYSNYFYREEKDRNSFNLAWNYHQKRNSHHWQYYVLINDSSKPKVEPLQMPHKDILEMVCDWMGAGRAIKGEWDVVTWYESNKHNILLHPTTRTKVECIIYNLDYDNRTGSKPEN